MTVYVCQRCLYQGKTKHCLRSHLLRTNTCVVAEDNGRDVSPQTLLDELGSYRKKGIGPEKCDFCKECFSCKASLSRHKKNCKVKDQSESQKNRETELQNEIDKLKSLLLKLTESNTNAVSTNNNSNNTNNIATQNNVTGAQTNIVQFNINAHGNENTSYLTHDFLTKCLLDATKEGFPNLIKQIHFNSEHPENQNIRGRSLRQNTIETYDGEKWKVRPANSVLDNLIQKGCKVFYSHLMGNLRSSDFKNEDFQMMLERNLLDLADVTKKRKSETYYRIRRNVFFMFFEDKPDEYVVLVEPDGQDIVESTLNDLVEA